MTTEIPNALRLAKWLDAMPSSGYALPNQAAAELRRLHEANQELLAALEVKQEKLMPITDDHGQALRPQYRVIEQQGQWQLLYDQHQVGNVVTHEFRIQKMTHDIALYPGITLAEAQKRFREKVEADHE